MCAAGSVSDREEVTSPDKVQPSAVAAPQARTPTERRRKRKGAAADDAAASGPKRADGKSNKLINDYFRGPASAAVRMVTVPPAPAPPPVAHRHGPLPVSAAGSSPAPCIPAH